MTAIRRLRASDGSRPFSGSLPPSTAGWRAGNPQKCEDRLGGSRAAWAGNLIATRDRLV